MGQQGWISIHRKLRECWIWVDKEPFDKRSAWLDLLLSANHADNKTLMNNALVEVKRGSFITSEVKLAERWRWDRGKVRRFLKLLENDNMLVRNAVSRLYVNIEIVNYEQYQSTTSNATSESIENTSLEDNDTTSNKQETHKSRTRNKQVTNINNNDNNSNNENKSIYILPYAPNVRLSEDEYKKLVNEYGLSVTKDFIERLNDYILQIGVAKANSKYKSHYAVIRNWYRKDGNKPKEEVTRANAGAYKYVE